MAKTHGYLTAHGTRVTVLAFADGLLLVSDTKAKLAELGSQVISEIKRTGMSINFKKSDYLTNAKDRSPLTVDRDMIPCVPKSGAIRYLVWVSGVSGSSNQCSSHIASG